MRNLNNNGIGLLILFILSSCGATKDLKQCQLKAIEEFSKGLTTIGTTLPSSYDKTNDLLEKNVLMAKASAIDTTEEKNKIVTDLVDKVSKELSDNQIGNLQAIDSIQSAWFFCIRFAELLKAVSNPEYGKTFSESAEKWSPSVDSLIGKYNYCFEKKIEPTVGPLLSSIAKQAGTKKIKKQQRKYVKEAIDTTADILFQILETLKSIHLVNIRNDMDRLKTQYLDQYKIYQVEINDEVIGAEKGYEILTELNSIRKELYYIDNIHNKMTRLCDGLENLIAELKDSLVKMTSCDDLKELKKATDEVSFIINQVEILNAHAK